MRLVLCLLVLLSGLAQAEVFRWTDENGKVHFGDRPLGKENTRVRGLIDPTAVDPLPKPGAKADELRAKYGEPVRIQKISNKSGEVEIWTFARSKRVKQDFSVKIEAGEVVEVASDTSAASAPAPEATGSEAASVGSSAEYAASVDRSADDRARRCSQLRESIEAVDRQQRQGGSAGTMDRLREQRRRYSDESAAQGC